MSMFDFDRDDPEQEPDEPHRDSGDGKDPYPYRHFYESDGEKPHRVQTRRPKKPHRPFWGLMIFACMVAVGCAAVYVLNWMDPEANSDLALQLPSQTSAQAESATQAEGTAQANDTAITSDSENITVPNAAIGSGTTLDVSEAHASSSASESIDSSVPEDALSLQEIYEKVIPSVVSITSTIDGGTATGTGIIMSSDGYLITNNHVIEDSNGITVLLQDDSEYTASLVGSDEVSDLAVLKIDAAGLTAAEFGSSENLQVGDEVVAIGDPLGTDLRGTMTDGIISAINRDLTVEDRQMTLIQTNAAMNSGNSGGPLINCYGQVIGINTMKMSSYYSNVEGLGFAIPISNAKSIIDELIAQGYVSGRPAIGITCSTLPQSALIYYRLPEGVYVADVDPDSDAAAQGITRGDIITAINGVTVDSLDELNAEKNLYTAGDTVTLSVYRDGEKYDVAVRLMDVKTN